MTAHLRKLAAALLASVLLLIAFSCLGEEATVTENRPEVTISVMGEADAEELVEIRDYEVPLSGAVPAEENCILHFILLGAIGVLSLGFTAAVLVEYRKITKLRTALKAGGVK